VAISDEMKENANRMVKTRDLTADIFA